MPATTATRIKRQHGRRVTCRSGTEKKRGLITARPSQQQQNGDRSVIPDLILYAGNELFPLMVRATAVHFLGNFNTAESNDAVDRALSDPASLVRHTAIMSFNSTDAVII